MGLGAALVDQARRVRTATSGARVEGGSPIVTAQGPWFPARLEMQAAPELAGLGAGGGPVRVEPAPTLIYRPQPADTMPRPSDRIEVDSPELGRAIWRVTGEPEPWRKKRRVIGYRANLERIVDTRAEAGDTGLLVGATGPPDADTPSTRPLGL